MVATPLPLHNITPAQLAHWGLLRQVRREELIDQYLRETEAPSSEQSTSLQHQWCSHHRIQTQEELAEWQHQQGMNQTEWQALVERPWRWSQWCLKHFEGDIPNHYLKRKPLLDQVSYSLLRVNNKPLATELYLRIKEGESSFEEIASNYSEGPERSTGGQLGPVAMQQPHPAIARLLQVSAPGQLWPPKQLEQWWIVVRLKQLHTTVLNEQTAQQLALELGDKHLQQMLDLS